MKKNEIAKVNEEVTEVVKQEKKKRNRPDLANFGAENLEKGDNARYLRHALSTLNLPPIDIADDEQVAGRIDWYFNNCIDNDMKPTVSGLCNCLGIQRSTLRSWYNGEYRAETHSNLIKRAYKLLEALWESYMMDGKINPASGIFLGRNHWGYQDKIDIAVVPSQPLGELKSQDEIERDIREHALEDEFEYEDESEG